VYMIHAALASVHWCNSKAYRHLVLGLVEALEAFIKLPEVHHPVAAAQSSLLHKIESDQALGSIRLGDNSVVSSKELLLSVHCTSQGGLPQSLEVIVKLIW